MEGEEAMTVIEAIENALTFLESLGYTSGDVHDDLSLAIMYVKKNRQVADKEF